MRAALTVVRELMRCRLMESERDALLERVAELLDATTMGALPFYYQLTPQAAAGSHGGPRRTRVLPSAPGGLVDTNVIHDGRRPIAPAPPQMGAGTSITAHGPSGALPHHPQDGVMGRATWSMGYFSEVFGARASEAYVPRMMNHEYTPEDDPGSFLEPGWEEEALVPEAFQVPPESPTNHVVDNSYKVPLISQGQAYANHESQVNQVTALGDGSRTAVSVSPGEAHWGLRGRDQEQGPSPRRMEQGITQR